MEVEQNKNMGNILLKKICVVYTDLHNFPGSVQKVQEHIVHCLDYRLFL